MEVIQRDIPAILSSESKSTIDFDTLVNSVPRVPAAAGDPDNEVRIRYQKLYDELRVINNYLIIAIFIGSLPTALANQYPLYTPSL
jgi:hypothetical protein